MYKFAHSILINRPVQEVFDFLSNPANQTKFQSGTESAEWISESPVGVGSTWRVVTKFLGRKIEAKLEVTGWDPPNQMSSKMVSGPIPFETTFKLESKENSTQLSVTS